MATAKQLAAVKKAQAVRLAKKVKTGPKKGTKTKVTIEKEIAEKAQHEIWLNLHKPLAYAIASPALGQMFVFRIDEEVGPRGAVVSRKHVQLTDPKEIMIALDAMQGMGQGVDDDNNKYYYVTTKEPDVRAFEAIENRLFGKPREPSTEESASKMAGVVRELYEMSKKV